jgi:hypothetical protein
MASVDSEGLEPSLSRVQAGCASVAPRAHFSGVIGGTRTRTAGFTDPCASLTPRSPCCVSAAVRPEGVEPSSAAYQAAALPLCYGRRERRAGESNPQIDNDHPLSRRAPGTDAGRTLQISRGSGTRTHDLTVPNRARCHCATPRSFVMEEGEGVEPSRLIALPFSRRLPSPIGLPFREMLVVGRVGIEPTSYGLRDRCNASVCYRPVGPTPRNRTETFRSSGGRADQLRQSGKHGVSGDTPRPQLCSCQR